MTSSITDIKGILVGHYTDRAARTGCTAVLFPQGAVGGVDVRGCAPGTRETDLLRGYNLVERIHGIMLSGGSAYGLDAASGAMQYLEERGIGHGVGELIVPIVPAAVIFDLGVGDGKVRPGKEEGYKACEAAASDGVETGAVGAGTGATIGKAYGMEHASNGGIGSACVELPGGMKVAALVVVNALGDVYDPDTGKLLAGATVNTVGADSISACDTGVMGNTTIGLVATNVTLTREQANKLATLAHDGLALSIRPVHTPFDGDTIFGVSTCELPGETSPNEILTLFAAAAKAMAKAVLNAVGHDK